eukprot:TRINITY_DN1489_c0_g1_i1.p1 TRINITY_DN1489_c0_g1~~TRINITY_DN1489_c0_g1_i1.p1  ORF type:complete len:805 (-),score=194.23 TRINITY_DN1489_c0_g1_i1:104-2518(-)
MIRRPPRSTLSSSSAASDVYKRQVSTQSTGESEDGNVVGRAVMSQKPNDNQPKPKPKQGQAKAKGGQKGAQSKNDSTNSEQANIPQQILQKPQNATPGHTPQKKTNHDGFRRNSVEQDGYHTRHHVEDGMYPNPWWRSLTRAELRWQKLYRALPPAEDVATGQDLSWMAFLRQDTELFDRMIEGRLSGRSVLGALGAHEGSAARKLNMPHSMVGHNHALGAMAQLSQSVNAPPEPRMRPSGELHDTESAAKHNRMLVLKYNSGCTPYAAHKQKPPSRPRVTGEECPTDIGELRELWSAEQTSSGLFALGQHNPHGMVEECGLTIPSPDRIPAAWGFSEGDLPPLASAPSARLKTTRNRDALELLVEVKSVCPYVYVPSKGCFAREHRTPNDSVQPWWVPQLQWDLFFEDCDAACVVSQSATRGMNIFTVKRNNNYVRLMLGLVRKFYQEYVLTGVEPPPNFFFDSPEHREFISLTLKIAQDCTKGFDRVSTVRRAVKRQPFFIDRPLEDSDAEEEDEEDEQQPVQQPAPTRSISDALNQQQNMPQQSVPMSMPMQGGMQGMPAMDAMQYQQMLAQMAQMGMSPQMMYGMSPPMGMAASPQVGASPQMGMYGMPYGMQQQAPMQQPSIGVPQYNTQAPQPTPAPAPAPAPSPGGAMPTNALTYEEMMAQMAPAPEQAPAPAPPAPAPTPAPERAPAPAPQISEREAAMMELQRRAQATQPQAVAPSGGEAAYAEVNPSSNFGGASIGASFGSSPWGGSMAPAPSSTAAFPGAEVWSDKPGDDAVWGNKPGQFEEMVTGMLDFDDM